MRQKAPAWIADLDRAVRENASDPAFRAVVADTHDDPDRLVALIRRLPYRFDGPRHRIASLAESSRRGWAACADAAAALLAWAQLRGRPADLVIEGVPELSDYAHVRVRIDGQEFDPYADRSLDGARRTLMAWRPDGEDCGCGCAGAGDCAPMPGGPDPCAGRSSSAACPIPSGLLAAAIGAHRVGQPIAAIGAHVIASTALLTGPALLVLWPVFAANLILFLLPYLLVSLFASCGNPAAALRSEATAARDGLRLVRTLYESHAAVRLIPFAGDFYNAAGLGLVALVPVLERRMPTATELEAGEGAMRTARAGDSRIGEFADAAGRVVEPSSSAKARASSIASAVRCAGASTSTTGGHTMTRDEYLRAVSDTMQAHAASSATPTAKAERIAADLAVAADLATVRASGVPGGVRHGPYGPRPGGEASQTALRVAQLRSAWTAAGRPSDLSGVQRALRAAGFPFRALTSAGPVTGRDGSPQIGIKLPIPAQSGGSGLALPLAAAAAFFFLR